jgi:hypothetical protein
MPPHHESSEIFKRRRSLVMQQLAESGDAEDR